MRPMAADDVQAASGQRFVHRGRRAAVHVGQSVGVGLEGERDAGVPQEFLDVLGVDVGVPEGDDVGLATDALADLGPFHHGVFGVDLVSADGTISSPGPPARPG